MIKILSVSLIAILSTIQLVSAELNCRELVNHQLIEVSCQLEKERYIETCITNISSDEECTRNARSLSVCQEREIKMCACTRQIAQRYRNYNSNCPEISEGQNILSRSQRYVEREFCRVRNAAQSVCVQERENRDQVCDDSESSEAACQQARRGLSICRRYKVLMCSIKISLDDAEDTVVPRALVKERRISIDPASTRHFRIIQDGQVFESSISDER